MLSVFTHFHCVNPSEACLLGSPIGALRQFLHSYDALCLLRNALALPKILLLPPILSDLDQIQRSPLEAICNVSLNDVSCLKLPSLLMQGAWVSGVLSCWLHLFS